jgi:hypothetical protein
MEGYGQVSSTRGFRAEEPQDERTHNVGGNMRKEVGQAEDLVHERSAQYR